MPIARRYKFGHAFAALGLAVAIGCTGNRPHPDPPALIPVPASALAGGSTQRPIDCRNLDTAGPSVQPIPVAVPTGAPQVRLVGVVEDVPAPSPQKKKPAEVTANPIDLGTALRLANAGNLQVAFAREQVRQALAREDRAGVLWLPNVRAGVGFNNHDGAIQQVAGSQIDASRGAVYFGLGASNYGNGSPTLPGIYANFSLADAIFQPLAAQQFAGARQQAAAAVQNDTLLGVALAYLDLLRANQEATIADESRDLTQQLAELTGNFAMSGEGLQSDADRMQAELAVRRNDVERAEEGAAVASARLAQLLRLDPATRLIPLEPTVVPIDMMPGDVPLAALVAQGLSQRPELTEGRLLTGEASARLRREEVAPLVPNVILGVSEGDFASGHGSMFADLQGRFDLDAMAYWELRNFGLGDRAARSEARSLVEQAQLRQFDVADQIAREVVEAYSQTQARRKEIETARAGIQSAIESHRHNLERIQNVKGLPIEALQSVQALSLARREYLRTVIDYDAAQFALYRAIGSPVLKFAEQPPHLSPAGK
ncbi:MAG TPA: TolC family protein [Pirellulales bacterium]|nr:TolC family protein [Pirellulales bacterium]